jgi:hypothetical protein
MDHRMQIIQDMLVALLVFIGGAMATVWARVMQQQNGPFVDAVLGPLGALALAMLVIYGLVRYLGMERKEAREANEARIRESHEDNERLRAENARLWQQIHGNKP